MICREIIDTIEKRYPKECAMEWDNVGLLAGRYEKEVGKIYIALDATDEVIEDAASWGADMLVTHHPMIFKALKKINDQSFIGRRVIRLIREDIAYYAMHTNYDVMGMADLAGEFMELKDPEILEETYPDEGIGRVADLKEAMTLEECCGFVKERLALPSVKVFGDPKKTVKRMAVSPGSGKSMIGPALAKGADVLVTGDIDHHEGIDALAQGLAIIDAGHYGTEYIFIADMEQFLKEHFPEAEIRTAPVRHPFWVM